MDIQSEKLNLIEWLAGINDNRIIKQLKALQKSSQEQSDSSLSAEERSAIDTGLNSISAGKTHSHDSVRKSTKKKYPHLF